MRLNRAGIADTATSLRQDSSDAQRCSVDRAVKMMMTMTSSQSKLLLQLNKFYNERVQSRRASVAKNLRDVCSIVQDVLKEVETQEPRFVSSLSEMNGHFEGLQVCPGCLVRFPLALFLQRVSIACYAERCISYDRFCLTDRLTV